MMACRLHVTKNEAIIQVTIAANVLLWAAAFGLYAVRYWPVLTRTRLDGKPG